MRLDETRSEQRSLRADQVAPRRIDSGLRGARCRESSLEACPGLAAGLDEAAAERARRSIVVEVERLDVGPWRPDTAPPSRPHLGILILEGVILRHLSVAESRTVEILNAGDVLRPWQEEAASFAAAEYIGYRVGARRPSVSAALAHLAASRQLVPHGGGWLLRGDPPVGWR